MKKYLIIIISIFAVISTVLVANAKETKSNQQKKIEKADFVVKDSLKKEEQSVDSAVKDSPKKEEQSVDSAVKDAPKKTEKSSEQGAQSKKEKKSSPISTIDIVLAGLNLLLTCLIVWVYINLGRLKNELAAYKSTNEKEWNDRIDQTKECLVEKIKASIKEYDSKKAAELEEAERKRKIAAAEAARSAQMAQETATANVFRGQTLYGDYNPADEGFECEWLSSDPKPSSQVRIDTTSETTANFTLLPDLDCSQINIIDRVCEIVAGNISDYNSYAVTEPGRLTLDKKAQVWKIEVPLKIKFIK